MSLTIKGGLLIGVLCAVWMFIVGFAGWHKDPALQAMFWVVILIQVGVLVWALRQTPAGQRGFWRLVKMGTVMSLIGGIVLFFASYLFTNVVFPSYFDELRTIQAQTLATQGMTPERIQQMQDATAGLQTPFMQAAMGFAGTVITGFIASMIIGGMTKDKTA